VESPNLEEDGPKREEGSGFCIHCYGMICAGGNIKKILSGLLYDGETARSIS
jgi:hypothetical protein